MKKFFIVATEHQYYKDVVEYENFKKRIGQMFNTIAEEVGIATSQFVPSKDTVGILPTTEDKEKFKDQFRKYSEQGVYYFKKTSPIAKRWKQMILLENIKICFHPMIMIYLNNTYSFKCSSGYFFVGDKLYVNIDANADFELPIGFTEINGSEFYKALEELESE